jgi:hypothetical protein
MAEQSVDRATIRAALRRLSNEEIYYILADVLEMLPLAKSEKLIKGYIDLSQFRPEGQQPATFLEEIREFRQASLRGDYYESFDVNSKNCTEISKGTQAWYFEFNRLLKLCVAAVRKGDKAEIRQAMEICFGLLHHIDEGHDDIIFFADEGGSWQAGVDWDKVLTTYFRCLSATAPPEEYANRVIGIVDEFEHFSRDRHFHKAKRIGTDSQRQALRSRLNALAESDKQEMGRKPGQA